MDKKTPDAKGLDHWNRTEARSGADWTLNEPTTTEEPPKEEKPQEKNWYLWYGPGAQSPMDITKVETVSNPFELSVALGRYNAGDLIVKGESYWFLTRGDETPKNFKDLSSEIKFYEKFAIVPKGETPHRDIKQLNVEWKQLIRGLMSIVKDNPDEAGGLIGAKVQVLSNDDGGYIAKKHLLITVLMNSSGRDFRDTIRRYLIQKVIFPQDEDHPMTYEEHTG